MLNPEYVRIGRCISLYAELVLGAPFFSSPSDFLFPLCEKTTRHQRPPHHTAPAALERGVPSLMRTFLPE